MFASLRTAFHGLAIGGRTAGCSGGALAHAKVLSMGLKTYDAPPDYSDMVMPDKPKLKFIQKVPNFKKAKKEFRRLNDIRGPTKGASQFTEKGQYGIVALGGGYIHWGHIEMIRLTINRRMDPRTTYASWRVNAPYKPITAKGLGKRMGGGKGPIDHYVSPVKAGRLVLEMGGKIELGDVERMLTELAKKLPFPAKVVSRESLAAMYKEYSVSNIYFSCAGGES
ncbi:39S ribosomal protein L16, mitochondrial isoform X2 [Engraulis encrasicolus]|uniref:39S ribosomal protein L16, mitochondrial isoform X2 n=1 Tax=Engraulis encrasicolus TaxID=184585 RepID=UPI002FD03278